MELGQLLVKHKEIFYYSHICQIKKRQQGIKCKHITDPLDQTAQIDFTLGTGTYEPKEHISRVLQF